MLHDISRNLVKWNSLPVLHEAASIWLVIMEYGLRDIIPLLWMEGIVHYLCALRIE